VAEPRRGMDHDLYPFAPLPERPAFAWPGGARVALWVLLFLEHWELTPPEGAHRDPRFASEFGPYAPDYRTWSQREYGNRVGIFRVLDVLDRHGIRPTVAANASACGRYPYLVEELRRRGAEFVGHGTHATRMITAGMSGGEERAAIEAATRAVAAAAGTPPGGWLGQDAGESTRTPGLLAEAGYRYLLDWANDEQPYRMRTPAGGLIAVPNPVELDDAQLFWLRRADTWRYPDLVRDTLETLLEEAARGGRVLGLGVRPWLFGMAHRIRYLDAALAQAVPSPGVWSATAGEIAAAWDAAHPA
jgi:allantoinase